MQRWSPVEGTKLKRYRFPKRRMEEKSHQQTSVVIIDEFCDTSCSTKENNAISQRHKPLIKVTLKEGIESSDMILKEEQRVSPSPAVSATTGNAYSNSCSPKSEMSSILASPILRNALDEQNVSPSIDTINVTSSNDNSVSEQPSLMPKILQKVKRHLSTLLQFANSIGSETGESVKNLIFDLMTESITIEEFHNSLQEVTKFPLKPFVLPFLKTYIPNMQREMKMQAKMTKQSVQKYVRQNESNIFDTLCSWSELNEVFHHGEPIPSNNQGEILFSNLLLGKRRYECQENNGQKVDSPTDATVHINPPPTKKHAACNNHQSSLYSAECLQIPPPPCLSAGTNWLPTTSPTSTKDCNLFSDEKRNNGNSSEWNNIYVMLNCILSMVEKTKRALSILQERNNSDSGLDVNDGVSHKTNGVSNNHRRYTADEVKRTVNEIMAHTVRLTEEKVTLVRKRAEEAVNDVKRQAILEIQKILSTADGKIDLTKSFGDHKKTILSNHEQDYSMHNGYTNSERLESLPPTLQTNNCWNCGRRAQDTCSGCNLAKYCGSFCQHKDWDSHHQICSGYSTPSSGNSEKVRISYPDPFLSRNNFLNDIIHKSNSGDAANHVIKSNIKGLETRHSSFSLNISDKSTPSKNTISRPITPITMNNNLILNVPSSKLKK